MTHKRKIAVVTGAARGIGLAAAERLAREGASVALCDIDMERALSEAQKLTGERLIVEAFQVDVANPASLRDMTLAVSERFGGLDILVNNAGVLDSLAIEDVTEQAWDRVMNINLKSVFFAVQAALELLKQSVAPRIVNVSSLAGRMGGFEAGFSYAASKGGMIALSMNLARKLAPFGITVNCVCPGTTRSDILKDWTPAQLDGLRQKIPLGRLGEVGDTAAAIAFLAGDDAGFITGHCLDVNGGMFMG